MKLFLLPALLFSFASALAADRPNILFLLTDDQRWDTIRALGNDDIQTPTFDRLVQQGFRFTNAYCQGSMVGAVCLPSRSMIATGRSLWKLPPLNAKTTPPGVNTLPSLMAAAGYTTFHCGKAGNVCAYSNNEFQTSIAMQARSADSATEMADHAITFLKQHDATKPFFMYLAPPVPHDPCLAPAEFVKLYDPAKLTLPAQFQPQHPFDPGVLDIRDEKLAAYPRTEAEMRQHLAGYYATISHMDHEFGRVLAMLKERGLEQRTLIVFSSDQGLACGGYHALMGKQNFYEDVKPPLVLAGPGIPSGHSSALVYLYDLYPTILQAADVPVPADAAGKSLLPIAQGKTERLRNFLFGAFANVHRMIRDDRWKLYKFNVAGQKHTRLFDLQTDPRELNDLAANPAHAEQVKRLDAHLQNARQEFGDPVDFDSANPVLPAQYRRPAKAGKGKPKQP